MNIKLVFTAALWLCFSIAGFSQSKLKMKPIEYNDYLSNITDSLYNKGVRWGNKFSAIRQSDQDYSRLKAARKEITEYIVLKKEEVRKTPTVGKGGENLKQAMLTFMDFEMDMIETGFMPLENMDAATPEKEVDRVINNLVEKSNEEGTYLEKVRKAQLEFADLNGFKIESGEEE